MYGQWFLIIIAIVILFFGFVLLFGPPYVPTLSKQVKIALDLLALKPGQTMLELGSGDGRVLKAAAQRGWQVVGYELNPILAIISVIRTWKYRDQVQIIIGNYWTKTWPPAEGIFTFMIDRHMKKLDAKIKSQPHFPIKLASFAFQIPGRTPIRIRKGVFLYEYH